MSMTRKEFEKIRLAIESEKFQDDCTDPVTYGIQRATFERKKFERLIEAAKQVNMQTARTKLEQWKRQLQRADQTRARFERIRDEIRSPRRAIPKEPMAREQVLAQGTE